MDVPLNDKQHSRKVIVSSCYNLAHHSKQYHWKILQIGVHFDHTLLRPQTLVKTNLFTQRGEQRISFIN